MGGPRDGEPYAQGWCFRLTTQLSDNPPQPRSGRFTVSVVVPVYNEQDVLPEFVRRAVAALEKSGQAWELIFVDDGSKDSSADLLAKCHRDNSRIKLIRLSRNFGQQPAISAGIHHATGDCVALIDADLQDPPELLIEMIGQWLAGYDTVIARRRSRPETGLRGTGMRLFYPVLGLLADGPHATAGIFSLMDRKVINQFNELPERNRFVPGLRAWLGFRQVAVYYDRDARGAGEPKQSLQRLARYAMDGIFSFSTKPLRLATYMGFLFSGLSFAMAIFYFITFFAFHKTAGSGFTTLIISVLFLGGVQLICAGILGEYIGRIYEEVKRRPLYVVREAVGFDSKL